MSQSLFTSLYETGEPFALIDTRERREYVNGQWFGSTNMPLSVLAQHTTRMVHERSFPIHLLDWQDNASSAAATLLAHLGYHNVIRHKTSPAKAFGHGYVKGEFVWSKAFGEVVAHSSGLAEITPAEYLTHHKSAQLFDVRPTAEYAQFTIPDSRSLPNSLLLANMANLRQSGEMALLHCAGRTRSIIGACTLKAAGYDGPFAIFKGGTQAWQLDGLEREHNASRMFAQETDDITPARNFLEKWDIPYETIDNAKLKVFLASIGQTLLFDVSDDAATGLRVDHGIYRISGTNLIQQTDRSIACYHVPVTLFDHGSGSRAAFAAYWLTSMGFTVRVVFLNHKLSSYRPDKLDANPAATRHNLLTTTQLLSHGNADNILDLRPSHAYRQEHLAGSHWANISELLADESPAQVNHVVIGDNIAHASQSADLLVAHGWQIDGIYDWSAKDIEQRRMQSSAIDSPIDQSALFAGRHHGNMQDSRDYLAWEEALPEQIDEYVLEQWRCLLGRTANTD